MHFDLVSTTLALLAFIPGTTTNNNVQGAQVAIQDTLLVGDPIFRKITLRPSVDTTEVFALQNGARRLLSTSIQHVVVSPDGYLIVLRSDTPRGPSIDSVWVDPGTFATRRHHEVTPDGGWRRIAFEGQYVRGSYKDSTGEHPIEARLSMAMIDNSIINVLANALPLAAGYVMTIPTYDIAGDERSMTMRVIGTEPLVRGSGSAVAWKVTMDFTAPRQKWTVTRWIDRSTRRELQWSLKFGEREMMGVVK